VSASKRSERFVEKKAVALRPLGGLLFTNWKLDTYSILAGCLALAGGVVAIVTLQIRGRFSGGAIALWAALYAIFVGYVAAAA
jgi:hypothetical protein